MNKLAAEEHISTFTNKRKIMSLVVLGFAFVMDLLDGTIVNIAIPSIQHNLSASYAAIQWIVAGYMLTFALLLIMGGRLGDVVGYKKVFLVGMGGFTLASLACGLAPNAELLILARLVQGAMAALMVPQVMAVTQLMYGKKERAKAMGIFGMLGGMAATLGPIIGGLLIQGNVFGWDWRPIFLINVPVGLLAFAAAAKVLPSGKSRHPLKLDVTGTVLLIMALGLLIFPLIEGRELGWPSWTFGMMAASLPILGVFAWYERRKDRKDGSALLVPALFKKPTFPRGLLLNLLMQIAVMGFFLTFTVTMQAGLGFGVLTTALIGIPTAVGIGLSIALIGEKLAPKLGRYVITIGSIVCMVGFLLNAFLFVQYGLHTSGWAVMPGLLIGGLGIGCIMSVMFSVTLQDVDTRHAGSASGAMSATQQIGSAIGVALIGTIFFGSLSTHANQSFDQVVPQLQSELNSLHIDSAEQKNLIDGVRTCFYDMNAQKDSTTMPKSCQQPTASVPDKKLTNTLVNAVKDANARNFAEAYRSGIVLCLGVLAIIFGLSFSLPRRFDMVDESVAL